MPHKRGQKSKKSKPHPYRSVGFTHPYMQQMQAIHPMGFMQPTFMGMMQQNMPMMPPNMSMMLPNMPMMQPMIQPNMPMMQSMIQPNMPMTQLMIHPNTNMSMMMPQEGSNVPIAATTSTASAPMTGKSSSMAVVSSSTSAPSDAIVPVAPSDAVVFTAPSASSVPSAPIDAIVPSAPSAKSALTPTSANDPEIYNYDLDDEEEDGPTEIVDGNPKHCGMFLPNLSKADDVVPVIISKASASNAAAKPTVAKTGRKSGTLNKSTLAKLTKDANEWANNQASFDEPPTRRSTRRGGGSAQVMHEHQRRQRQQGQHQSRATRNSTLKTPDFENDFSDEEDNDLLEYD